MTELNPDLFEQNVSTVDLGVFLLPPALEEENVAYEDTRANSEGYTSRIYQCCY